MGRSRPLLLYFRLFNSVDSKCSIWNVADEWIWTLDFWNWKRPLYQLSHNQCQILCILLSAVHVSEVLLCHGQRVRPAVGHDGHGQLQVLPWRPESERSRRDRVPARHCHQQQLDRRGGPEPISGKSQVCRRVNYGLWKKISILRKINCHFNRHFLLICCNKTVPFFESISLTAFLLADPISGFAKGRSYLQALGRDREQSLCLLLEHVA